MHRALFLASVLCVASTAHAQTSVQELSRCLADSTTGKDRKDLAQWVFLAMASHPEIKKYASGAVSASNEEVNRTAAALFTRLLADSCLVQTRATIKEGGTAAIKVAFETLGQLAMQELMTNPDVIASTATFEKYLDRAKLARALSAE